MPNPAWMVFGSWQKCLAGSKPTHPGYKIVSQDAGLEESGNRRPSVFVSTSIRTATNLRARLQPAH